MVHFAKKSNFLVDRKSVEKMIHEKNLGKAIAMAICLALSLFILFCKKTLYSGIEFICEFLRQ